MKFFSRPSTGGIGLLLPFAVLLVTIWKAFPTLTAAWNNDLYSRGGMIAFAIWTATQIGLAFLSRRVGLRGRFFWVAASLGFFAIAGLSELNVFYHLSLACAVPGFLGLRMMGVFVVIASAVWLPATGYFVSNWKAGGLSGWERPGLALAFAVFAIGLGLAKPHLDWLNRGILKA